MCQSALLWLVCVYGSLMMSSKIIPPPLHWLSSSDWEMGGMRGVIRASSRQVMKRRKKGEECSPRCDLGDDDEDTREGENINKTFCCN